MNEEELLGFVHKIRNDQIPMDGRLNNIAKKTGLRKEQLICAIGFNPIAPQLPEIYPIIGFEFFDNLAQRRNDIFTTDIYRYVSLDNILATYAEIKDDSSNLQIMQYLLAKRLEKIENRIEETVNSLIIEKYKAEMRVIYNDGIANIELAEERLNRKDSGFRALLNEVAIIIESKLIPAGDIFFTLK